MKSRLPVKPTLGRRKKRDESKDLHVSRPSSIPWSNGKVMTVTIATREERCKWTWEADEYNLEDKWGHK